MTPEDGADFMESSSSEQVEPRKFTSAHQLPTPWELVTKAFGLQAGSRIHEVGLAGRSPLRSVVVVEVVVSAEPLAIAALRVQEDGNGATYLIPWHAISFLRT